MEQKAPPTDAEIISGLNKQITSAKEHATLLEGILANTRQQLSQAMGEIAELAFINSQLRQARQE